MSGLQKPEKLLFAFSGAPSFAFEGWAGPCSPGRGAISGVSNARLSSASTRLVKRRVRWGGVVALGTFSVAYVARLSGRRRVRLPWKRWGNR